MPLPLSPASNDLGLGTALSDQVKDESDEDRKKRLAAAGRASQMSPGAMALLGPGMGMNVGGT